MEAARPGFLATSTQHITHTEPYSLGCWAQANVKAVGVSLGQLRTRETGFCGASKRDSLVGRELAGHAHAQDFYDIDNLPPPKGDAGMLMGVCFSTWSCPLACSSHPP